MGIRGRRAARPACCGTFSSSTMIVMMMAITPSMKASNRPLLMFGLSGNDCPAPVRNMPLEMQPRNHEDTKKNKGWFRVFVLWVAGVYVKSLVKDSRLDHSALGAGQWVKDDERSGVEVSYDCPHLADLQPGDDAVQDVLFGAAHAAVTLEDRHTPTKVPGDPFADRAIQIRHDRDGRVLIDAIQHEVERFRSGNVCEDGVQRCIDAQHRHGDQKQCHIEPED